MDKEKYQPGKRTKGSLTAVGESYKIATANSNRHAKIFDVTLIIKNTSYQFLVDTGADISVVPFSMFNPVYSNANRSLVSANNAAIKFYGDTPLSFNIQQLQENFKWTFAVADVTRPILGADFLSEHKIIVDCALRKIFRRTVNNILTSENYQFSNTTVPKFYEKLISETQSIKTSQKPRVSFKIETNGRPVAQRQRRLFGERWEATKNEFDRLLKEGTIIPSKSDWASPLVLVKKSDGSWRPCGDYRMLNEVTKPDKYPLPRINDLLDSISGKALFSKLDLKKAYHQIPVDEHQPQYQPYKPSYAQ